jgi:hypothetical protein
VRFGSFFEREARGGEVEDGNEDDGGAWLDTSTASISSWGGGRDTVAKRMSTLLEMSTGSNGSGRGSGSERESESETIRTGENGSGRHGTDDGEDGGEEEEDDGW